MKRASKRLAVILSAITLVTAGGTHLFAGEKKAAPKPSTVKTQTQAKDKAKDKAKKPATAYDLWIERSTSEGQS